VETLLNSGKQQQQQQQQAGSSATQKFNNSKSYFFDILKVTKTLDNVWRNPKRMHSFINGLFELFYFFHWLAS
jgi:hypothetical protein